jgi:hypothetical protein
MGCGSSKNVENVDVPNTSIVPVVDSPHTPESVNKITPIHVPSKEALMRLFSDYDLDGNGHVEVGELVQMMTELKTATGVTNASDDSKVQSDAVCVMKILDADGNGTLEAEEFVKWVTTGLSRPQADRNEVASMSQINRRMDNFLTSVSIVADELDTLQ